MDLQEKHARGEQEQDHPDRAPTGEPYKRVQREAMERERQRRLQEQQAAKEREEKQRSLQQQYEQKKRQEEADDNDDSDDDDWLLDEDDDPALEALRQRRLQEMRQVQMKRAENLAKGHGQYRTIGQDEFLPECTGSSEWVVVHFFHKEFQRCQIMDHHLKIVAEAHPECKVLRIDAEKAPFFVAKLKVQVLPTVLVFQEGKAVARLVGFESLAENDEWPTSKLQSWIAKTGAIQYVPPSNELQEEMKRLGISTTTQSIWRGGPAQEYDSDE